MPTVRGCCSIIDKVDNNNSCSFERPPKREYRADSETDDQLTTGPVESYEGESEGGMSR